jgi:RimJ/RimL family protein N-acetyltransferase
MSFLLQTERLELRLPQAIDFHDLLSLRTDPDVMRYIGDGAIQSDEQVNEHIRLAQPYYDETGYGFFTVFKKESGEFIGQAGLFHLGFDVDQPEIELAYRLHKNHWGNGYATELARSLIHWGFTQRRLKKIVAGVHRDNQRSVKVLQKAGLTRVEDLDYKGTKIPGYAIQRN